MAQETKEILERKIAGFKAIRDKGDTPANVKKAMESAIEAAEKKLAGMKEPAPADGNTKKKKATTTGKKAAGKKAPAGKEEDDEDNFITVMYEGKPVRFNINNCPESEQAMFLRDERDKQTNKRSKSRSVAKRAETNLEHFMGNIVDLLPEGKKNTLTKDNIKKAEQKFRELFELLGINNVSTEMFIKVVHSVLQEYMKDAKAEKK